MRHIDICIDPGLTVDQFFALRNNIALQVLERDSKIDIVVGK
jgi:hypothetical protein